MTNEERKAGLEAIIYAADEPATIDQLTRALGEEKLAVQASQEFLMRFGLSDLEDLPSLKEFEALAREALGSDQGFAPAEGGLRNEASREGPSAGDNEPGGAGRVPADLAAMEAREELLEQTAANNEGMPELAGEEAQKAATAGE